MSSNLMKRCISPYDGMSVDEDDHQSSSRQDAADGTCTRNIRNENDRPPIATATAPPTRTRSPFEDEIPRDCRVRIICHLRPKELYGAYGLTCTQCHEDSLSETLSQKTWGEISAGSELERLLKRMAHRSYQRAFNRPRTVLKMLGHTEMLRPDISWEDLESLARKATLTEVTTLDLSVTLSSSLGHSVDEELQQQRMMIHEAPMNFYPRALSWALARALPNLVELDLSNLSGGPREEGDLASELSVFGHENTPGLYKVTWRRRIGGCRFLRGNDLQTLEHLKELHLDGLVADFRYDSSYGSNTYGFFMECAGYESDRCIFFRCNDNLERVSLVGSKYIDQETLQEHPFPQSMLIKFVQGTPSLKWFRSDLKRANVEMLRAERPNVVFC
mmetsp:Transcript_17479/g.50026  ORF Transcript_17479/g.50026 Transcript_17479/m.50026 type:complete len:389 (+) Transcript_17479:123-1289(+)